jgi:NACalpha-BTF3-like transcription factor
MPPKNNSARIVGGSRRTIRRGSLKLPTIAEQLNAILTDRKLDYQTSKPLPEVGAVEFFSNTENHKLIMAPTVRVSNRIHLVILDGELKSMTEDEKAGLTPPVIPTPKENDAKKENKFNRRFKEQLVKICKGHTIIDVPDISLVRLMIQRNPYIINEAKVQYIEDEEIVLIWGDLLMMNTPGSSPSTSTAVEAEKKPEDGTFNGQIEDADFAELMKLENDAAPELVSAVGSGEAAAASAADVPIPDGSTFTMNDVEMVMQQTGKSRQMVINALSANNGDLIETIMKLS